MISDAAKPALRRTMRARRDAHVADQPDGVRALLFNRPPAPLLQLIAAEATIGLYAAIGKEAPTLSYARFFHERGHPLALPRFADRAAPMAFARWCDPFADAELVRGAFGLQPGAAADELVPEVVFVPLLAFDTSGARLGQGGGHYDRWLAAHPETLAIGLAWDDQLIGRVPTEPHDRPLAAVVTPSRLYGPFA